MEYDFIGFGVSNEGYHGLMMDGSHVMEPFRRNNDRMTLILLLSIKYLGLTSTI